METGCVAKEPIYQGLRHLSAQLPGPQPQVGKGSLSEADARRESIGGYDQAAYQFHVAHVLYETGDLPGSIAALKTALRAQPKQERQARVHFNAVMAQRQFQLSHIEEPCLNRSGPDRGSRSRSPASGRRPGDR